MNDNDEYFCCMQHLLCAQLQEFDNAAYVNLLCIVYISYWYSLLQCTEPFGKVNSVN